MPKTDFVLYQLNAVFTGFPGKNKTFNDEVVFPWMVPSIEVEASENFSLSLSINFSLTFPYRMAKLLVVAKIQALEILPIGGKEIKSINTLKCEKTT